MKVKTKTMMKVLFAVLLQVAATKAVHYTYWVNKYDMILNPFVGVYQQKMNMFDSPITKSDLPLPYKQTDTRSLFSTTHLVVKPGERVVLQRRKPVSFVYWLYGNTLLVSYIDEATGTLEVIELGSSVKNFVAKIDSMTWHSLSLKFPAKGKYALINGVVAPAMDPINPFADTELLVDMEQLKKDYPKIPPKKLLKFRPRMKLPDGPPPQPPASDNK